MTTLPTPVLLGPNQPPRFYSGGAAIAELRGEPAPDRNAPEDWVGSTTTLFGEESLGLTRLDDGRWLREAVRADPEGYLGAEHVAAYGADPALLVKLLDTGQRLPVHCHPDRAFAAAHLGSRHGKTEAWVVLGVSGSEPTVHLGFRDEVDETTLRRWVEEQDTAAMLDAMNPLEVRAGETVLVPAGVPHAIGAGIFVVELQEPTDLSVMLERNAFGLEDAGDLGLGDLALGCVDRTAWGTSRIDLARAGGPGSSLLPADADPFFRADLLRDGDELPASYGVLVATAGAGSVQTEHGGSIDIRRGATVLVPHAAGAIRLSGDLEVVAARPPAAT